MKYRCMMLALSLVSPALCLTSAGFAMPQLVTPQFVTPQEFAVSGDSPEAHLGRDGDIDLQSMSTSALNSLLAQRLADAHQQISQREGGLEPKKHELATLVAAHAMINSTWESAYSAALNAALNAVRDPLRDDTAKAAAEEAQASAWNAARGRFKSGLRGLALVTLFAPTAKATYEHVVDDSFAAAVPAAWRVVYQGALAGQPAVDLGKAAFRAAEHAALVYLVKHAESVWEFAYDQAADNITAQATGLHLFFSKWPTSDDGNEFFMPYQKLAGGNEAL